MTRRLLLAALAGTSLLAAPAPPALAGPSFQLAADARSAGRDAVRRDGALRPGGRLPLDLADDGTTWGAATKVYDGHPCTNETEPVLGPLAGEITFVGWGSGHCVHGPRSTAPEAPRRWWPTTCP